MTFRGDVALITGAASGMGQLSAWRLAAEGVKVAALDIDEAGLARTAQRGEHEVRGVEGVQPPGQPLDGG